ncbi:MAG: DUF5320 family protein [Christensenellales bacterium]
MPGFDGTGPMGQCPGTGGGFGVCGAAGAQNGFFYARRGRGCGRRFRAEYGGGAFASEVAQLRAQVAELTEKLQSAAKEDAGT